MHNYNMIFIRNSWPIWRPGAAEGGAHLLAQPVGK